MKNIIKILLLAVCLSSPLLLKAQVTIGSNLQANDGALLDLKEYVTGDNLTSNRGFNLPRVALQALDKLEPCATTNTTNNEAHQGLVVYNMTENSTLSNGIYYWNGANWQRLLNTISHNNALTFDLLTSIMSTPTTPSASENGTYTSMGDVLDSSSGRYFFRIQDPGSYAFAIRMYGEGFPQSGKTAGRACLYFTLMVNGVKKDVQEVNFVLVDPAQLGTTNKIAATILLTGSNLKKGDKIEFVFSNYTPAFAQPARLIANAGARTNKTSLIYWRL